MATGYTSECIEIHIDHPHVTVSPNIGRLAGVENRGVLHCHIMYHAFGSVGLDTRLRATTDDM